MAAGCSPAKTGKENKKKKIINLALAYIIVLYYYVRIQTRRYEGTGYRGTDNGSRVSEVSS